MGSSGNCVLPEGVVLEILSRLPVKSVLRFKCVCKFWYTLIQTPDFINNHYNNQKSHLLVHHRVSEALRSRVALFPDETFAAHKDLDYIELSPFLDVMLGPINGLFLLRYLDRFALWNPATREFRVLPVPDLPSHFVFLYNTIGFGLDPLTDDYKVVWIPYIYDEKLDRTLRQQIIGLYTLGNDSWRYLDDPVLDSVYCANNSQCMSTTYLNGKYYWLSNDNMIVLFDMSTDVFKEIQGPDSTGSNSNKEELCLHNNSIALFRFEHSGDLVVEFIDIWVMKEEEEKQGWCWTKDITVGPLLEVRWPLGVWKNGEVFLQTLSSQLVLYDPNTHGIRYAEIQGTKTIDLFFVFNYKESLVSVKGGCRDWDWDENNFCSIFQDFMSRRSKEQWEAK